MPSTVPAHSAADQRAIVWMPVGMAAPVSLAESLKKRGVPLTVVHSELLLLAHACSSHNNETVAGGTLVVLCEPAQLPRVAEAVIAMRRYAASAVVYVFQPGARLSLREVEDQDLVNWAAPAPATPPTPPLPPAPAPLPAVQRETKPAKPFLKSAQPKLRLTEPMPMDAPKAAGEDARPTLQKSEDVQTGYKPAPQIPIPAPQSQTPTPTTTPPPLAPPAAPIVRDDAPPSDVLSADELAMLLGRNEDGGRP